MFYTTFNHFIVKHVIFIKCGKDSKSQGVRTFVTLQQLHIAYQCHFSWYFAIKIKGLEV